MNKRLPPLHSLTWMWCSLLAYGVLFLVLQRVLPSAFRLPESVVLLFCGTAASAVPLLWAALTRGSAARFSPRKVSAGPMVFLFSAAVSGNLAVTLLTPLLERLWRLAGFTAQAVALGEETPTPLLAAYICVIGPVLEELVYRGVVLRRLLPGGERQAVVLSALCFALMHHDLYQGLSAFWSGLIFGYAALRYGLAASVGLHIAGNSIAVALPLLRQAGTAGALVTLLLVFVPVGIAVVGGLRLLLKRRGQARSEAPAGIALRVWRAPALWLLLAFDAIYLVAASFTRR